MLALPTLVIVGALLTPGEHGAVMGDGLGQRPRPSAALNDVCADGSTLAGIDVSVYQGTIDWDAVAADGVDFAFIRVSHSLQVFDTQFDANWAGVHEVGIHAGVYQYFEPDEDPIAQAQLLLEHMGPLMPGDLPPVIDVESAAGLDGASIASAVGQWLEYVEAELGVRPIIYTGPYFWQDNVGSDAFGDYPLWIAHYGTSCPLTPEPWLRWDFHQYSSTGSTAGIVGDVDQNFFNGSLDDLLALGTTEIPICGTIAAQGGILDNEDDCYRLFGNAMYWRPEAAGIGGGLVWTNATDYADPSNYAVWSLWFEQPGDYEIEVAIDPTYAETQQARYQIGHADGEDEVVVDQSAEDGWVSLGTYPFLADTKYEVRLGDNTGEAGELERAIVFDALRLTRIDEEGPETDTEDPSGSTTAEGTTGEEASTSGDDGSSSGGPALPGGSGGDDDGCGCRSTTNPVAGWALLGLVGLLRRRRRG